MIREIDISTEYGKKEFDHLLMRLGDLVSMDSPKAKQVADIIAHVNKDGDSALVHYMQKWCDPEFSTDKIAVSKQDLSVAQKKVSPKLLESIKRAIDNVKKYQNHIKPTDLNPINISGAQLGLRYLPVDSAGLYVPGGTAVLFSTLIMLAVPALVAGVCPENISIVCPPPTREKNKNVHLSKNSDDNSGDISPALLATAHFLGINKVFRLGGAQAIAALALGSQTVGAVDIIAGPGNVYVQLAKAQVSGRVGTDNGFYGPSEIVTLADNSARPENVASDLIAQAEHNPGKCFLVTWDKKVSNTIISEIQNQLQQRQRKKAITSALKNESASILASDKYIAIDIVNKLAAEHVNLAVENPKEILPEIKHGGEIFLSDKTPVAAGDYYAGPSHCLPTATTARFTSGISVHTFLRRSSIVSYPNGLSNQAAQDIDCMAKAEGLDGHAHSAQLRSRTLCNTADEG